MPILHLSGAEATTSGPFLDKLSINKDYCNPENAYLWKSLNTLLVKYQLFMLNKYPYLNDIRK